jgi:molybdopterin-containing oxidoreductase family iron-sulfur binding subunit
MIVDMNSCIGCGNCVVACNAENNVPVVGKQEVLNRREMHWMRIDRYYSSQGKDEYDYANHELPEEYPAVVYQPLMCQHCNNAPCETVCPVVATTHSTEGLNQMTYNRCIGTRYCANNCPYKVRRFNWFSYPQNPERFPLNFATTSDLGRMVLNPDVTVRARGVMEKCSMCIQRIQEGKLHAKKESRRPIDGEIVTACQQSCPTDAILFGDMNDPISNIGVMIANEYDKRAYHVLDEINVRPSVSYLTKIRNQA